MLYLQYISCDQKQGWSYCAVQLAFSCLESCSNCAASASAVGSHLCNFSTDDIMVICCYIWVTGVFICRGVLAGNIQCILYMSEYTWDCIVVFIRQDDSTDILTESQKASSREGHRPDSPSDLQGWGWEVSKACWWRCSWWSWPGCWVARWGGGRQSVGEAPVGGRLKTAGAWMC